MVTARVPSEPVPEPWIRSAVRLRLDLLAFDEAPFAPYVRRQQSGVDFTTMAEVGGTPEHSRALYELNKTCSADIPGRGDFYTFDEYTEQRLQPSDCDLRGIILAVSGGAWVGMAATSIRWEDGCAVSDMTGVLTGYRRRGIALAMKLLAIEFARSSGMRWLMALHHPRNAAAIGMNRRLGFADYDPRTGK